LNNKAILKQQKPEKENGGITCYNLLGFTPVAEKKIKLTKINTLNGWEKSVKRKKTVKATNSSKEPRKRR